MGNREKMIKTLEILPWRAIVHYGLHIIAPVFLALFFKEDHRVKAYLIMLATMLVDLDHLFADPVFDSNRMSVGFHPLHSYFAISIYIIMCLLPFEQLNWPWWLRAVAIGLVFHMITDWQDYVLWL